MPIKTVENSRIIAGLFREAVLTASNVSMLGYGTGKIVSVVEDDRRSGTADRLAEIQFKNETLEPGESRTEIALTFQNFIATAVVDIVAFTPGKICIRLPESMDFKDLRRSRRIEARFEHLDPSASIVVDKGKHYESTFSVLNISTTGLAGILTLSREASIGIGARIISQVNTAEGVFRVNGRIVMLTSPEPIGDVMRMTVRVARESKLNETLIPENTGPGASKNFTNSERRSENRFAGTFEISLCSLITPNQPVKFEITNASISGFAAICKQRHLEDLIIPGVPLKLEDTSLIAEPISYEYPFLRCVWVGGDEKDRARWLRRISPLISESVQISVSDAGRLMQIFCASGAFSTEFLKSQRSSLHSSLQNIEDFDSGAAYIHRWVDYHNQSVNGHISCIRMGDNSWFATDLVKSVEINSKLSDRFVEKFLSSFSEFSLSLTPTPLIFLIWVKNHPFWMNLNRYLSPRGAPEVFNISLGYTRLAGLNDLGDRRLNFEEINSSDFERIEMITNRICCASARQLAISLDFSISNFGSPRLLKAIADDNRVFWRKYIYIQSRNFSGLAILTALPDGMNPNRVIDSAWYFELDGGQIDGEDWKNICSDLKRYSSERGQSLVGIRRVASVQYFQLIEGEDTEMTGYLVHPKFLLDIGSLK